MLDRAIGFVSEARPRREDEPTGAGSHADTALALARILQDTRLRLAEQLGDTALAAELAQTRMVGETDGGVVASLAMLEADDDATAASALLTRFIERSVRDLPPTQPAVGELRLALAEILARDASKRSDAIAALDAADAAFVELPATHALRVRADRLRATLR